MKSEHRFTKWLPNFVFYNSETKSIYDLSYEYEDLMASDASGEASFCTELSQEVAILKPQMDVILQIKKMMKNSLPKQIKGLPNGKSI